MAENLENWQVRGESGHKVTTAFPESSLLMVTWEGSHLDDPRVEQLAQALRSRVDEDGIHRGGLKQVAEVESPRQILAQLKQKGVELEEGYRRLEGYLIGAGNLRVLLTEAGRSQKRSLQRLLTDEAKRQFNIDLQISEPFEFSETAPPALKDGLPEVLISADYDLQIGWEGMKSQPELHQKFMTWVQELSLPSIGAEKKGASAVEECYRGYGTPVTLRVHLSEAGRADLSGTIGAIRELAARVGITADELRLGGVPPVDISLRKSTRDFLWQKSATVPWYQRTVFGLSLGVMLILTAWFLRSLNWTAVVCGIALITLGLSRIIPGWQSNQIGLPGLLSLVFLFGCAMTLALPWLHLQRLSRVDSEPDASLLAQQRARVPYLLGMLCLLGAVCTLWLQRSYPFQEFAIHATVGVGVIALLLLYVLPILARILPSPETHETEVVRRDLRFLGRQIVRWRHPVTAFMVVALLASCYGLKQLDLKHDLQNYLSASGEGQQDNRFLERNICGSIPVDVTISFDKSAVDTIEFRDRLELLRALSAHLKSLPDVSGACSLADLVPVPTETQKESATGKIRPQVRQKANSFEKQILEYPAIANWYLPLIPSTHAAAETKPESWKISLLALSTSDQEHLLERLDAACQSLVRFHAGVQHHAATPAILRIDDDSSLKDAALAALGIIAAIGTAVFLIQLHNPLAAIPALLPILFGTILSLGIWNWRAGSLDLVHLLVAPLVLGLNAFLTVNVLATFRHYLQAGHSRFSAATEAFADFVPVVMHVTLIMAVSMGMLICSDFKFVSMFGRTWLWMMAASLPGLLFLLPALSAGWLGMCLEMKSHVKLKTKSADSVTEPLDEILEQVAAAQTPHRQPLEKTAVADHRRRIDPGPGRKNTSRS
ncbi:MAG: MMPL family transporter [Planctomycetales bacterium]